MWHGGQLGRTWQLRLIWRLRLLQWQCGSTGEARLQAGTPMLAKVFLVSGIFAGEKIIARAANTGGENCALGFAVPWPWLIDFGDRQERL